MTRVDFHILGAEELAAAMGHVCKVTDKAWRSGHRVLIVCETGELEALDERLWNYRPDAFIPHQPLASGDAPVNITDNAECGGHHDVMVNLSRQQPASFSRFERLIEVVFSHPEWTDVKRGHFRFYKERGYPLHSHRL